MSRINVIGDGVVALCSAHSLLMRGFKVRVFGSIQGREASSWGCAGHIATEQCDPLASWDLIRSVPQRLFTFGGAVSFPPKQVADWLPFAWRYIASSRPSKFHLGRKVLEDLLQGALESWRMRLETLGAEELLDRRGHIICWDSDESARRGIRKWEQASPKFVSFAQGGTAENIIMHRLGIPANRVARFHGTGSIKDLYLMRNILREAICAHGGEIVELKQHIDDPADLGDESVLIAAGIGSRSLAEKWGLHVPMISERGYHLELDSREFCGDGRPVVFEDRSVIMSQFRHGVRLASFVEFGNEHSPPDPAKWERLKSTARSLGFDPSAGRLWHGSRPTLPDYIPAIGEVNGDQRRYYAFGHQHLGLTLGSVTGEIVAAMIDGERRAELKSLSLDRFQPSHTPMPSGPVY